MLFNPCRRHRTISSQLSNTVRRLQSDSSSVQEICSFRNTVPKTFPVEVRPSQRTPPKGSSKVLLTLSKANLAFTDSLYGAADEEDYILYTPGSDAVVTKHTRHNKDRQKVVLKVFSLAGAELADQFVLKYPRTFTMRFPDSAPCAGHHITDTCLKQDYVKGYQIFQTMKKSKTQIPLDDANKLLDLFCHHSYKNPKAEAVPKPPASDPDLEPEPSEVLNPFDMPSAYSEWYHVGKVDIETSDNYLWSDTNAACELFGYMDSKDSISYNLLIQYMIKHARKDPELLDEAYQLYRDMVRLDLKPLLRTVKALIYSAGYYDRNQHVALESVLNLISQVDFKPDAEVLLLLLKVHSASPVDSNRLLLDEFLQSDIPCSFWELRGIISKEKNFGKRGNHEVFRKLQHVLTLNCAELEDYELLKNIPDNASELTAAEVVEFLDYMVTNDILTKLPTDKALFARKLLYAFSMNKESDLESMKLVNNKLKEVLREDVTTQQDCLRFIVDKASTLRLDLFSRELLEVAERINELEPLSSTNVPLVDCLTWYTGLMMQHCIAIANTKNTAEIKEEIKQLQAINIRNMLKIQNNDLYPNTQAISSLIITTLHSGDTSNAWELLNLYHKYLLEPDLTTTRKVLMSLKSYDSYSNLIDVLNPSMRKQVQQLRKEQNMIMLADIKAYKQQKEFKKKISKSNDVIEIL